MNRACHSQGRQVLSQGHSSLLGMAGSGRGKQALLHGHSSSGHWEREALSAQPSRGPAWSQQGTCPNMGQALRDLGWVVQRWSRLRVCVCVLQSHSTGHCVQLHHVLPGEPGQLIQAFRALPVKRGPRMFCLWGSTSTRPSGA